ncbi:MAG TPA: FlgO family outer membrane protein [Candidatus Paceibacterota bacterium]|nr:FlgO family outer membrane protein [Candidatus Paceibacterota bacterium]
MLITTCTRLLLTFLLLTLANTSLANTPSNFDMQMAALAGKLADGTYRSKEMHVAVVGFTNLAGKETELGNTLSEEMTTRLFQTGKFNIVERTLIVKVLKEQKLELTGPIDTDSIKSLGRLLKVEAIITGRFVNRPNDVRVFARLVDTMTGEIRSLAAVTLEKDALVLGLLGEHAPLRSYRALPPASTAAHLTTHFPEFTVEHKNFTFVITRSYKDELGAAVFEIMVTNNGPTTTELTFGKSGWLGDDGLLQTNWGTTYGHPRIGIAGSSRSLANNVSHVFPAHSSITIVVQFRDAGKNVYLCSSLALPVTGLEDAGRQRYITFTDLPKK